MSISSHSIREYWFPVKGFPRYMVNPLGEVKDLTKNRMLRNSTSIRGSFGAVTLVDDQGISHHRGLWKIIEESICE